MQRISLILLFFALHASLIGSSQMDSYIEMKEMQTTLPLSQWSAEKRLLFHTTEISLDDYFNHLLKKAHRLYLTKNYVEALKLYTEVQQAIHKKGYPRANKKESLLPKKLTLEIAKTHYKLANYNNVLSNIENSSAMEDRFDCELLYLAAKTYKKTLDYQKAIEFFENYLGHTDKYEEREYLQALYELGTLYYKCNNLARAKNYLEKIVERKRNQESITLFAKTTLCDIHLQEKEYTKAKALLNELSKSGNKNKILMGKVSLLYGKIEMEGKNYTKAASHFNRALALQGRHKEQIALSLAHCYLSLEKEHSKAEKILLYLLDTQEKSSALLLLATLHLKQNHPEEALTLLHHYFDSFSLMHQHAALLLMGRASNQYEYLLQATSLTYADLKEYSYGWFCRALFEVEKHALFQAMHSFETAFSLLKKEESLPQQESFSMYDKDITKALSLLSQLHTESNDPSQFLYLQGVLCAYFDNTDLTNKALAYFKQLLQEDIQEKYNDKVHYMMGSLFYRQKEYALAKEHFLALLTKHPHSDLAAASWYWSAESTEQLSPSSHEVAEYRQHLFEKHPESFFSAEAYFKFFSTEEYVQGKSKALLHLKEFAQLFPHSTLNVAAFYLLSLHESSKEKSMALLDQAQLLFDNLSKEQQKKALFYFYTKALLKKAKLLDNEPDKVIALLKPLIKECAYRDEFKNKNGICFLLEECQFTLATAYIKNKKIHKAQKLLFAILDTNQKCGVEESYFLALTWQAQGKLAFAEGNIEAALESYSLALKSGATFLTPAQKTTLWHAQNECATR